MRASAPVIGAALVLVAVVVWSWAALWLDAPVTVLLLATVCGTVPVLVSILPGRAAGAATLATAGVGAILVLAAATDSSLLRLLSARPSAWRSLVDRLDAGISGAATIAIPLSDGPSAAPVSAMLVVLLAMIVFLIMGIAVVTRRPLAAVVTAGVALAYAWTLAPPAHPLTQGVVAAAAALLVFAARRRPGRRRAPYAPARVLAVGAGLVTLAAAASTGAGDEGWWDWRSWNWGSTPRTSAILSIEQRYGPLEYPDEEIEVLRVRTARPAPLRAVALDAFDGAAFTVPDDTQWQEAGTTNGAVRLAADRVGTDRSAQIRLTGTQSRWVFADGPVTRVASLGERSVRAYADGSVAVEPELRNGTTYTVSTRIADPGPARLLAYRGADPAGPITIAPGAGEVDPPPFASGRRLPIDAFGPLAPIADLSRRVIGDASTQYEAVNRVEAYMRGNFRYDTSVAAAARPELELSRFLFVTRTGYCQHFAGAMALMLRMNGIPARVAVGFNVSPSRYVPADGTYRVVDRDAHSWVEVDFGPEYGWLPFDPTPGRGATTNSASVSSTQYAAGQVPNAPPTLRTTPVDPVELPAQPVPDAQPKPVATDGGGRPSPWWLLVAPGAIVVIVLLPVGIKRARRARRGRGGERARVLGAAHELESWLVDVGVPVDPASTPGERADAAHRALGIDAGRIYGLAGRARFGPGELPAGSGDRAWKDLRRAKRSVGRRTRIAAEMRARSLRRRERS